MSNTIMNTYGRFDVTFEIGKGCKLYDICGDEYIDFVSGVAVNCLGHSHPAILNAISEQSKKLIHISNYYWNKTHTVLSDKLIENSDHSKVFFCNSGTEAVEAALKLSRKYGKLKGNEEKSTILYMSNSFHGRTMGALSVTGQEKYKKDFRPLISGVKEVKFNDSEDLRQKFDENVCAVIIEPIQGEGGINTVSQEFLENIKMLCTKYDSLLIFDEIQCGIGRLGSLFAYKKFNIIPDVICIAKALGGGFPIGAIVTNEKTSNVLNPGDHGTTFGGNPLGCAVGNAVIDELVDGKVIDEIEEKSKYIKEKLYSLKEQYGVIEEVKGMGLLIGFSINTDIKEFAAVCFENKLLVASAGTNVIRLLPPLNVTKEELFEAIKVIEVVIKQILEK